MRFGLSPEQRMLQDSMHRLLAERAPLARVREVAEAGSAMAPELWQGLSELGAPALLVPESVHGLGLGMLDAAVVCEALGYAAAPVPFIGAAVMAPVAVRLAASPGQRREWLPAIAAGVLRLGVGVSEHAGSHRDAGLRARGQTLSGTAHSVLDFAGASAYLLADDEGVLYRVSADAPGLERIALTTIDRTRSAGKLVLRGVPAERLAGSNDPAVVRRVLYAGRVALAADTLGAAQCMLDQAVAYAKERRQFNRVIGSFQAVKHLCAEMAAELEPSRALLWYAAHALETEAEEGPVAACLAKAHLAEVGKFVARTAIEVHGGIGFTDLLGLHYWFKRIGANRQWLGTPERAREDAARLQGW